MAARGQRDPEAAARARAKREEIRAAASARLGRELKSWECFCGCGVRAPLATYTAATKGYVKGETKHYVRQHHSRLSPLEYVEEDRGFETPCWIWQRGHSSGGRPSYIRGPDGRDVAYRVIFRRHRGPIPEGLHLHHLCDVSMCVNPYHLEPLSADEHRARHLKLTAEDHEEIRTLFAQGWRRLDIADAYGVSESRIKQVAAA